MLVQTNTVIVFGDHMFIWSPKITVLCIKGTSCESMTHTLASEPFCIVTNLGVLKLMGSRHFGGRTSRRTTPANVENTLGKNFLLSQNSNFWDVSVLLCRRALLRVGHTEMGQKWWGFNKLQYAWDFFLFSSLSCDVRRRDQGCGHKPESPFYCRSQNSNRCVCLAIISTCFLHTFLS